MAIPHGGRGAQPELRRRRSARARGPLNALVAAALLVIATAAAPALGDLYRLDSIKLPAAARRSLAMYSPADAPADTPPGNGEAFVAVSLRFVVDANATAESWADVVVVRSEQMSDAVGYRPPGGTEDAICCSDELLTAETPVPGCTDDEHRYRVIVNPDVPHWRRKVRLVPGETATVNGDDAVAPVNRTGIYYLVVAACAAPVTVSGMTTWMNPYGYLPGSAYGFLPFYYWMTVAFVAVAAAWFALNVRFFSEVVMVQNCISAVLFLSLVEMTAWHHAYNTYNVDGARHTPTFVAGTVASVTRRTVSRALVVAVSLGYGVVRPSLGEDARKIAALCGLYFVFGLLLELETAYNGVAESERFFLVVPVAALDAVTYWWIFLALFSITQQLETRKQLVKLALFRSFARVLAASFASASAFALFQVWFIYRHEVREHWQWLWLFDAGFWQMMYAAVLVSIMVLWRPNMNSRRYAYAAVETDDPDDDVELYGDYTESDVVQRSPDGGFAGPASGQPAVLPLFEVGDGDPDIDGDDDEFDVLGGLAGDGPGLTRPLSPVKGD